MSHSNAPQIQQTKTTNRSIFAQEKSAVKCIEKAEVMAKETTWKWRLNTEETEERNAEDRSFLLARTVPQNQNKENAALSPFLLAFSFPKTLVLSCCFPLLSLPLKAQKSSLGSSLKNSAFYRSSSPLSLFSFADLLPSLSRCSLEFFSSFLLSLPSSLPYWLSLGSTPPPPLSLLLIPFFLLLSLSLILSFFPLAVLLSFSAIFLAVFFRCPSLFACPR